jgi:YebC/PmpR family DNA-binding regulatory protein
MSGHSKWSTIKRAKGVADARRGATFTKLANAITLAAKLGSNGDPNSNPRLRYAVDAAREVNMPKENIQRAIDRGLGKLPGQTIEEVSYEGFGPSRVAFLIEGITDNKNRTTAEIKNIFDRSGGMMGSTAYLFDKKGEIKVVSKGGSKDDEELELIDAGIEDLEELEEDSGRKYLVYCDPSDLGNVSKNITQLNYTVESAEIAFKPNQIIDLTEEDLAQKVIEFAEKLEDHDDIQKVYANFDIPENILPQ